MDEEKNGGMKLQDFFTFNNMIKSYAQTVYDTLGTGYQECIYSKALQRELSLNKYDTQSETVIPVKYKDAVIGYVRSDITILPNGPILELKAVKTLNEDHVAQLKSYLKLTNTKTGYLINFPQNSKTDKISIIQIDN